MSAKAAPVLALALLIAGTTVTRARAIASIRHFAHGQRPLRVREAIEPAMNVRADLTDEVAAGPKPNERGVAQWRCLPSLM
jgi:hypothetical protein